MMCEEKNCDIITDNCEERDFCTLYRLGSTDKIYDETTAADETGNRRIALKT
jgi:hypothetical protein